MIGRNEGERLERCLLSVLPLAGSVVYVDSGSTDGSVELARRLQIELVQLDMSRPFTAARARNAGFARLREVAPGARYVQFVDGDCEVVAGWLEAAVGFLDTHATAAAACGRRRERFPERSIFNRMCDLEWDTPVGPAKACGGDVMMRVAALAAVGGYRAELIAGEEPELCVRLRAAGWEIWRLDHEMTLHDAAMTHVGQWWKRTMRSGYAFAEGAHLHGAPPERHWVRESRSALLWGAGIPALAATAAVVWGPSALAALAVYPLQCLRLALRSTGPLKHRASYAALLVLGKFPEAVGHAKFMLHRWRGSAARLIEYK